MQDRHLESQQDRNLAPSLKEVGWGILITLFIFGLLWVL